MKKIYILTDHEDDGSVSAEMKNKVRFRFLSHKTKTTASVLLPVCAQIDNDNVNALRTCAEAVNVKLDACDIDHCLIWTFPGNAVKSYEKKIAVFDGVEVRARLVG